MSTPININSSSMRKHRKRTKQKQKQTGMKTYVSEGQLNLKLKLSMQEYQRLQDSSIVSGVHMRECVKRGISLYHDFIMRAYEKHQAEVAAARVSEGKSEGGGVRKAEQQSEVTVDGSTSGQSEILNTEGTVASEQPSLDNSAASGGQEASVDSGNGT